MNFKEFKNSSQKLIENQIFSLDFCKNQIDEEYYEAFKLLMNTNKKIVFSGVGKSGHIARKVAASYSSTGTSAIYIDPLHAAHGDLGMAEDCEVAVLISHSGNTKEIVDIIPALKNLNMCLISITSNSNSKMAKLSDLHINTYVKKENCPHNLAPTISTTTTLVILDTLMVLIMKEKDFKKNDFAKYHPAGSLGKKLLLKVEDIMKNIDFSVLESSKITDIIESISKIGKGFVPVLNSKKEVIGVITDGDLRRAMEEFNKDIFNVVAYDIMTKKPKVISKEILAIEALEILENYKITGMPVVSNSKLIGIIHIHDIINEGINLK